MVSTWIFVVSYFSQRYEIGEMLRLFIYMLGIVALTALVFDIVTLESDRRKALKKGKEIKWIRK